MTLRFFPVSIIVRGDVGIPDRTALNEINELLREALAARGQAADRYELQHLDPGQFVVAADPPAPRSRKRKR